MNAWSPVIQPLFTPDDTVPLLPSCVVDTNEWLRQRALRLVKLGFSQKILAGKMGMQAATFSRWLRRKDGIGPASVTALDGFHAYIDELTAAITDAIRLVGVLPSYVTTAAPDESLENPDGAALALPGDSVHPAPVPNAQTQLREQFERAVQEEKRQTRAARKPAAATRPTRADRHPRPRQTRR